MSELTCAGCGDIFLPRDTLVSPLGVEHIIHDRAHCEALLRASLAASSHPPSSAASEPVLLTIVEAHQLLIKFGMSGGSAHEMARLLCASEWSARVRLGALLYARDLGMLPGARPEDCSRLVAQCGGKP